MESKDEVSDTDSGIILQSGLCAQADWGRLGGDRQPPPYRDPGLAPVARGPGAAACREPALPRVTLQQAALSPWCAHAVLLGPKPAAQNALFVRMISVVPPHWAVLLPLLDRGQGEVDPGRGWGSEAETGSSCRNELSASDDSSLSDGLLLEEEESQVPKPPPESPAPPSRPLPPQSLEGLQPAGSEAGGLERAPIQNSPWKETSLDHPYEKPRKSSEPNSESSSPATTPQDGPSTSSLWLLEPASYHVVPIRSVPGQRQGRTSAPATPEIQGRRGQSQSLRTDSFRAGPEGRGRSAFPRRRPTHYTVTVPDSCFPAAKPPLPHPAYHSCSEDSGSDVSSISHPTSPGSSSPDISFLRPLPGPAHPNLSDREGDKKVATVYVPRRSPEGAPVQVFVPEKGEISSQV
nr:innate immunity activator protein [Vulpes vulpes]